MELVPRWDMAQTVAVFHEQGDQPWADCTEQPFKNMAPTAHTSCTHPRNRLWTPGNSLSIHLTPQHWAPWGQELFSVSPIVDRVHSLEMSAESPVLAERLEVMATVKKGCLHDSHLYRKCYMERRKQGGREGVLESTQDTELKNYPKPMSVITWEGSL